MARHPRFHLHFTPTRSSWLNLVERFFRDLTEDVVLAGAPDSFAIITTDAAFGFTKGVFDFEVSAPSGSSVVIQSSMDLQTWIPLQTNLLVSGHLYFSDSQPLGNAQRF